MPSPLIAIVGAPNVGKSTLFNRLTRSRRAIVTNEPGVTRDRQYGAVEDAAIPFRVVDTGGLTPRTKEPFAREIEAQATAALDEAAVALLVVDARAGATALDRELAELLRRRDMPILLVANKVDGAEAEMAVHALHELGLGDPQPVSAEHGRGIDELVAAVERLLLQPGKQHGPDEGTTESGEQQVQIAIVGRPNVGKSSLLNRLLGEQRVIVSDIPGTTRDAIDTLLTIDERRYRLIDTAGIRRPGRREHAVERLSVLQARQNLARADVAILVLDASAELTAQDAHIAGMIQEAYKPMIVAVNKWDLVEEREQEAARWEARVRERLRFAKEVPIVYVSARTGQRVLRLLERADDAHAAAGIRVPTVAVNRWLQQLQAGDPDEPPPRGNLRFLYATQTGIRPPRFLIFCNDPARAVVSVRRQLVNSLRERFHFGPAPIRLEFRGRRTARSRA